MFLPLGFLVLLWDIKKIGNMVRSCNIQEIIPDYIPVILPGYFSRYSACPTVARGRVFRELYALNERQKKLSSS